MRSSAAVTRSLRSGLCLLIFTATLVTARDAVHAECVGDCTATGLVSITDLILGVNIVLELRPPAACPAFQNAAGQVDIAQLIKGVNNALNGCPPPGQFEAKINADLVPLQAAVIMKGNPERVVSSRDAQGVQSDFVEGVVVVRPKSDAELQDLLARYGGTVVDDNTIPEPPPELGITLTDEQRKPSEFVVRIDLAKVDTSSVAANASAAGLTGVLEFSSDAGLRTFAGNLEAKALGFTTVSDWVSHADQVPLPVGAYEVLLSTQEQPTGATFQDSFTEPRYGTTGGQSNVTLAWQFVAAHGFQRRVHVAIIDGGGYLLDTAGRALRNDHDFPTTPTRPFQYDFANEDAVADGPSLMSCATVACLWHGSGCAGVAAGILDNRLGEAGTGGLVAHPMLFKFGGSNDQRNAAIRTAVAWGAEVVSMSFGADCDTGCRVDDRGDNPFSSDNITDAVNDGSRTAFVASAGNGRGNPAIGYNVRGPCTSPLSGNCFVHPCTLEHVICVGALNDNATTIQSYSNFGSEVALFAPTNIRVMDQPAASDPNPSGPSACPPVAPFPGGCSLVAPFHPTFGGTSASAPFVAGVAAMLKALNPNLSGDDVARILIETAHTGTAPVNRYIDAYAAVRRAAEGIDNLPDRFEPNNGDAAPTDLGKKPSYSEPNLSLNANDHDFFKFESPGASQMTITLQSPGGLGNISVINLLSLGNTCGSPRQLTNTAVTNGRVLTYNVPGGLLELGLRADDVTAYNLSISFAAPGLAPDTYEVNDVVAAAKYIHSFGAGLSDAFVIDPMVTIDATLHNNTPADVDYYIVRGARLSNPETALLSGGPFVSLYANTAPMNMSVYQLNPTGTQGTLVGAVGGSSCASGLTVSLQPDVYYLVRIDGGVGQYTLFNGAIADPAHLPPILVGDFPDEIIKPGPVEIDKQLRFPEIFLFVGDPAFDAVRSINPGVHLSLFDLNGGMLADGVADGQGERLSLPNLLATQAYAVKATPMDFSAGPPTVRLAWEPAEAVRVSDNLIQNPGAEITADPGDVPLWTIASEFAPMIFSYGDPDFPSSTGPGPADRGLHFFAGGNGNTRSALRQVVVIDPVWQEAINAGRAKFRFSAFLGGYLQQADSTSARLIFRFATGDSTIGVVNAPTITSIEREGQTGLFPVEVNDRLPADTGVILVDVFFQGGEGTFNDGYADNFELVLSEYAGCTPTTCAAPGGTCGATPDGCGGTLDCGPCPTPTTTTPACLALRAQCQSEEECCQDGATTCDSVCCHFAKETCAGTADCCGAADCRDGFCCVRAGGRCDHTSDCCLNGFEGECDNGTCMTFCRGKDAQCDDPAQCCQGDQCINGRCRPPGCLPAGYRCTGVAECCENEQTFCGDVGGTQFVCCHPNGGACAETRDCCGNTDCCSGLCCGPGQNCCLTAGTCCQADATCCGAGCCPPDRDCCNGTCCPAGQFCSNGSCACLGLRSPCDPANNQCCQSEPTSCLNQTAGQFAQRCCRPKGGTCGGNLDCCRNFFLNANLGSCSAGVCGGDGAACAFHEDCVSGHCFGHCSNVAPVHDCFTAGDCPSGGLCIEKECTHCPASTRPCGNACCAIGQCCGDHCCP